MGGIGVKWARSEGVFIGPKSSGRSVQMAYVRYYYTAVRRLSRTSRYLLEGILKSSVRPILLAYIRCTIHIVQSYFLLVDVSVGDHRTFALQIMAYIRHVSVHPH